MTCNSFNSFKYKKIYTLKNLNVYKIDKEKVLNRSEQEEKKSFTTHQICKEMEEQSRKVSTYCYLTFSGMRILKTPFRKLISECPRKSCGKLGTGSVRITLYRHFTGKQKNIRNPSESQEEFKLLKSFSELVCGIWESGRQFKTCYRQHLQFATPVVSLKNPGYIFPHFKPPWETISLWLHWVLEVYWAYKRVKTGMNTDLCMHIHRYTYTNPRSWYRCVWLVSVYLEHYIRHGGIFQSMD